MHVHSESFNTSFLRGFIGFDGTFFVNPEFCDFAAVTTCACSAPNSVLTLTDKTSGTLNLRSLSSWESESRLRGP